MHDVRLAVLGVLGRNDPSCALKVDLIPRNLPDIVAALARQGEELDNAPKRLPDLLTGQQHFPELLIAQDPVA